MYNFVGKLMGLALRTGNLLNMDLPSLVWKHLVGETVTPRDVLAVDLLSFNIIGNVFSH